MAKKSGSKSRNIPPAGAVFTTREAFEPEALDIGYALDQVIEFISGEPGVRRVTLNYISNPKDPPQFHRREDRTESILKRLQRIRAEWNTLPASHAEAILIRAGELLKEAASSDDAAQVLVERLLVNGGFFAAIQKQVQQRDTEAEKPLGDLPLTSLKSNGTAQALIQSRATTSLTVSLPEGAPTEVKGSLVGA
jgi:hypothetical protein